MNGLLVEALSYIDDYIVSAFIMALFGMCGIAFMRRLHEKISRHMIVLSAMYLVAMVCDALHFMTGDNVVSTYFGQERLYTLISIVCQAVAATMWLAFVQSNSIRSVKRRRFATALGILVGFCLVAFCIVSYIFKDNIIMWEDRIGSVGVIGWAIESSILIIYSITLIYALLLEVCQS